MRLDEISNKNIWYHGSSKNFDKFDIKADKANRGTNVEGIYLTRDEDDARDYANQHNGIVYEVEPDVFNTFKRGTSTVNDNMIEKYVELMVSRYNGYSEKWVRQSFVPDLVKYGTFADVTGEIKRLTMEAGGYDSAWDGDVLIVFDPNDITILNKFRPQELVKDPDIDAPSKEINDKMRSDKKIVSKHNQKKFNSSMDFMDNLLK